MIANNLKDGAPSLTPFCVRELVLKRGKVNRCYYQNIVSVQGHNVVVAVNSSGVNQTITMNVTKHDKESLIEGLKHLNIDGSGIEELVQIVETEPKFDNKHMK